MPKKKSEKKQKSITKSTKSKGLGDTLEKVFKKTGIDKVAKWVLGEDCGCDDRKEKLNYLMPSIQFHVLVKKQNGLKNG